MKSTASRNVVGVVNFTTWIPSLVVDASSTVMLSGIGRSKGTLLSALAAVAFGDGVVEALGQVGVGSGRGDEPAVGALLPPHPASADAMTAAATAARSFTPPRYANRHEPAVSDTIWW